MTKLEEDIENVLLQRIKEGNENTTYWAHRIAEEVCKGYIERAFDAGGNGMQWTGNEWKQEKTLQEFLKSEGITE